MPEIKIKKGDNLTNLAKAHGTSIDALLQANPQINNPNMIYAGKSLALPEGASVTPGPVTRTPFEAAFTSARSEGKSIFNYNGTQYNTRLKDEVATATGTTSSNKSTTKTPAPKAAPINTTASNPEFYASPDSLLQLTPDSAASARSKQDSAAKLAHDKKLIDAVSYGFPAGKLAGGAAAIGGAAYGAYKATPWLKKFFAAGAGLEKLKPAISKLSRTLVSNPRFIKTQPTISKVLQTLVSRPRVNPNTAEIDAIIAQKQRIIDNLPPGFKIKNFKDAPKAASSVNPNTIPSPTINPNRVMAMEQREKLAMKQRQEMIDNLPQGFKIKKFK